MSSYTDASLSPTIIFPSFPLFFSFNVIAMGTDSTLEIIFKTALFVEGGVVEGFDRGLKYVFGTDSRMELTH